MTLINYLTRVHFADGVLEEAVRSEMEFSENRSPLILIKKGGMTEMLAERLLTAMPTRSRAEIFELPPTLPDDATATRAAEFYREAECDMLIACGGRSALSSAKLARLMLVQSTPPSAYLSSSRLDRLHQNLPDLLVVPDNCGLCSAATPQSPFRMPDGTRAVIHMKELTPTAAIFDPTLTLGSDAGKTA
ncbi:MAG: iron-containing alcohol dehydrogenase, partial [Pseudomonadota bacterium]